MSVPISEVLAKLKAEIQAQIEAPGQQQLEADRFKAEKIYLNDELDRLLRMEDLTEKRNHNENLKQDRTLRKAFANKVFILTCCWSVAIFTILILVGSKVLELSDKVLITLITSTTINFFSFFLLVMKYLFRTERAEPKKKDEEPKK